nr:SDR family oxidoreductase [Paenibacillus phyllosphaerae]
MEESIVNHTVLITGASSGIGYELAKLFAQDHYRLILVARNRQRLEQIREELLHWTQDIAVIEKDLSRAGAAEEVYREVRAQEREVQVLVNNAGFGLTGHFAELPIASQLQMIQLNIAALTELTHLFAQDMIAGRYGRILNVGSVASFVATPSMSVYAATKAYVLSFSESLGSELRRRGDITVTALCPGPTKTNFAKAAQMGELETWFNKVSMSPEAVARAGYNGLKARKAVVIPGGSNGLMTFGLRFIPRRWVQRAAGNILTTPDQSKPK